MNITANVLRIFLRVETEKVVSSVAKLLYCSDFLKSSENVMMFIWKPLEQPDP